MALGGSKRPEFTRKVGAFTGKIVAINPGVEQIQKLFKLEEPGKEPEYVTDKDIEVPTGVEADGTVTKETKTIKHCRIDVYIQDTKTENVTKKSYFLQSRGMMKRDLSKYQYINELGKTAWVDDAANLPKKFTDVLDKTGTSIRTISNHIAIVGEAELVEFLDSWLSLDKTKQYSLEINTRALFQGNYKELQGLVNSDLASLIMGHYTVRGVDGENGTQFYQDVWKKFLPAFTIKFFQANNFTPERIKEIVDRKLALDTKITNKVTIDKQDWLTNWEKYILEITGEYGCKDAFDLGMAKDFDPQTHYATQAATIDDRSNEY